MVSTLDDGHYNSQASAEACQIECQNTNGCEYWTWDPGKGYQNSNRNYTVGTVGVVTVTIKNTLLDYHSACWKKTDKGESKPSGSAISGPKFCGDPPQPNDCFEYKTNYYGFDMEDGQYNSQASAEACQIECQNTNGCEYWTWDPSMGLFLIEILKEFYNNSAVI